jgi:hypothetical protein
MSTSLKFEHIMKAKLADFATGGAALLIEPDYTIKTSYPTPDFATGVGVLGQGEREVQLLDGVPPSVLRIQEQVKVYGEQLTEFSDGKREKDIYIQGIAGHPAVTLVATAEEVSFCHCSFAISAPSAARVILTRLFSAFLTTGRLYYLGDSAEHQPGPALPREQAEWMGLA